MKNDLNMMIFNGKDIGISKIELDESDLLVTDKTGKYCLHVYVMYNRKEIELIEVGEGKKLNE